MERRHLIVSGRVQGVGFRWSCWREARALGLTGWVRNCADGCVEVVAEGPAARLDALSAWCRHGPPHARVDRLDAASAPAQGAFATFDIREDG